MDNVKLESRILLTVLILGGMSPGCYFIYIDAIFYGVTLLVLGVAALLWVWKPWKWFKK